MYKFTVVFGRMGIGSLLTILLVRPQSKQRRQADQSHREEQVH